MKNETQVLSARHDLMNTAAAVVDYSSMRLQLERYMLWIAALEWVLEHDSGPMNPLEDFLRCLKEAKDNAAEMN